MRPPIPTWTLAALAVLGFLLSSCSNAPPQSAEPLFGDAAFDSAALDAAGAPDPVAPILITAGGTLEDGSGTPGGLNTVGELGGSPHGDPQPGSARTTDVLPEADGVIIYVRHDETSTDPWAVILYDLTTEESLEVYRGEREVQSVAIDGQDTAVLSARETTDPGSDLEIFRADLDDESVTRLTDTSWDETNVSSSTDGNRIGWQGETGSGVPTAIWQDVDTGDTFHLDTSSAQLEPSLSGDGRFLTLVHDSDTAPNEVLLFDIDTTQVSIVASSSDSFRHPSAADGGSLVAWVEERTGEDAVVVGDLEAGSSAQEFAAASGVAHPHLADSGRWLAYSERVGADWQLHTRDIDDDLVEVGPASAGDDLAAYWRLSYECTVEPTATGEFRPLGLTCDSE